MKATIFFMLLSFALNMSGQNQMIIQFNEAQTSKNILAPGKYGITQNPALNYIKQLSNSLNIYLFEFDRSKVDPSKLLETMQRDPTIKTVQFNAPIDFRGAPNDALFFDQWQYHNNGFRGMVDADIDALSAWEITKGGYTADGHDIVVAIIDGGVNLDHPDLEDNIWRNKKEIPDNGMDDDENGFVDDDFGWNFNDENNDISNKGYGHWHGTPVAGIIGAKGDNEIGVAGVNWNIKMMNLVANQQVSDIIAAYDYVYQMRKKFNDTNGVEGAFIVATNTSLGINHGNPLDHPIWCEMYDLLGQEGVLSVASTANAPIDVDIEGDLPTTCDSDFLISVTNTNKRDELAAFAAYGLTHIDLGAPGSEVFTTNNAGSYGRFGGTSAAAPHVAGAIALLYAAPVESLMQDVGEDPGSVALNIKQHILEETDKIHDLAYKTVSGGRLNLYKSLMALKKHYKENLKEHFFGEIMLNRIFPNPADEYINIDVELGKEINLEMEIFNSIGQLIDHNRIKQLDKGKHQIKYAVKNLQPGIYHVFLTDEKQQHRISSKIMVY